MKKVRNYIVSTNISSLQVQARNKKEAKKLFKIQLKGLVLDTDKITVK